MQTYQDLLIVGDNEENRMTFVRNAIDQFKVSPEYEMAKVADEYYRHQNRTILQHENMLTTVTGRMVKDEWSPNHKSVSNFFFRFITMQNQYLLGNGIRWSGRTVKVPENTEQAQREWVWDNVPTDTKEVQSITGHYEYHVTIDSGVKEKLGADFDNRMIDLGEAALVEGVSFAYYCLDHIEVFKLLEFVPLFDEDDGALKAGIRFWQISPEKPLRATLYEIDGYTDYIWRKREIDGKVVEIADVYSEKKPYININKGTQVDGYTIYDGRNYDGFPIVPLYGNKMKQSEFVGMQDGIDAYDFIKNGFENDLDSAKLYWIIRGAGGDDNTELARFLDRLKVNKVAAVDDGQDITPVTVNIPYAEREALLNRIAKDLYDDFMSFDITNTASSTDTATGIKAMYTAIDLKCDLYESCITDFLLSLLKIVGIKDKPIYTRNQNINKAEEIDNLLKLANYVDSEYITRKGLSILGDTDAVEEVLKRIELENMQRMGLALQMQEQENPLEVGTEE